MPEAICGRSHLSGVEPFLNGITPLLRTVRSQVKQKSGTFSGRPWLMQPMSNSHKSIGLRRRSRWGGAERVVVKMANKEEAQALSVSYRQALLTLGVFEVETVGRAQAEDPDTVDREKLALTKLVLDSIEAYVAALFGLSVEEVHEGLASIPPADMEQAIRARIVEALS